MLVVEFTFPAGRFHATPWDRQVNEGQVEWPPSPWRIVRALQAVWLSRATDTVPEPVAVSLIEALSMHMPHYALPPASVGHTRHYLTRYRTSLDGKTDSVFDTFASVARERPLSVVWPTLDLEPEARQALDVLLDRLTWLGRAESWVSARRVDSSPSGIDCRPAWDEEAGPGQERVRFLCPRTSIEYGDWKDSLPQSRGRARKTTVPETLFEALMMDTAELKAAGWSQPPGGRWVDYLRPVDCLDGVAGVDATRPAPRTPAEAPTMARFGLGSPVLPDITESIRVGEKFHAALVKISGNHPTFTGMEPNGTRRRGHRHAHFLGEPGPQANGVRYVTVWAPEGFDDSALEALAKLTWLSYIGSYPVQAVFLGAGRPEEFLLRSGSRASEAGTPLVGSSTTWCSLTPFVPTRHTKTRGTRKVENGLRVGGPEHDLRRLLRAGGFPDPVKTEFLPECVWNGRVLTWARFRTRRLSGEGLHGNQPASGWRIVFPEKVQGPLCLGYGSHFGLGLFGPEVSSTGGT